MQIRNTWWRYLRLELARNESLWARAVVYCGVLFALLMVGLCALSLYQSREDALARTDDTLGNMALIAERDIERNIELQALSLQGVVDSLGQPEVTVLPPHLRRQVLFDRAASAPYLGSSLVLDAQGNIILDSENDTPRTGNFADRPYFTYQRDNPDGGLYVSDPFFSRLRNGSPSIALTRRVNGPDGKFAGIAMTTIQLSYFHDLFGGLELGPKGTISLISSGGTLIMRQPYDPKMIGHNFNATPIFERISATPGHGAFTARATTDGVRRLYSFRHFPNFPLIISVAAAEQDIYENWQRRAIAIGALMLIFGSGFIWLSVLLSAQLRRRMRAETELKLLARTDGLTGLNNRRTLGEILDSEWRRAQRTRHVFSLLFVDLDHFKAYNDTYGHLAGDKALAAVAQCIGMQIRQPPDSAARYGGEEFVIVLPDTTAQGASIVADKLVAAIGELGIPHASSQFGHLTASVGAASWDPARHNSVSAVIKAADDALYQAKAAGRNMAATVPAG